MVGHLLAPYLCIQIPAVLFVKPSKQTMGTLTHFIEYNSLFDLILCIHLMINMYLHKLDYDSG